MIKKILAWVLVLVVGYVVLYSYFNSDELKYREVNPYSSGTGNYIMYEAQWADSELPFEPLVKKNNPFVYYALKFQGWLVVIGILWWILDLKGSKAFIARIKKRNVKRR